MNPLLEQLHDIEGLDPMSWWPLAEGWWILIAIGIIVLGGLVTFACFRLTFLRSWKNDTFKKLERLEQNLSEKTARETLITLSEYLRRIALKRYSRKECAALMGDAWLKWLTLQDPQQFDWENKGTLLIEVPYSPVNCRPSIEQIRDLIRATREWIR